MATTVAGRGIIWVASYPKSGNTWMRFALARLLQSGVGSSAEVEAFIPEAILHPGCSIEIPDDHPVLLKTHWAMSRDLPLMSETLGFVYLVRNPLDVLASLFYFNRLRHVKTDQSDVAGARARHIEAFIRHGGNPLVGSGGGHTSWIDNVLGWTRASREYPSVIVRYEDMLEQPVRELRRVMQFFNRQVDNAALYAAVRNTSFRAMKKLEEQEIQARRAGFFYHEQFAAVHEQGARFMRKGKAGEGRRYLVPEQLGRFAQVFGPVMGRVGYLIDPANGKVRLTGHQFEAVRPLDSVPTLGRATVTHVQAGS